MIFLIIINTVNSYGEITNDDDLSLNDRNKTTYNHANTWKVLPKRLTHGKPFDYYPRGRVEINNCKAIIYANPNICTDEGKNFIISEFNLNTHNGINEVILKADGSSHYQCYLDKK